VVSVPFDRDQPHNAARVEAVGAGVTVAPDAVAAQLADAVERARLGEDVRIAAHRMAEVIAGYGECGVDEVEALLA
jgi:UDP:flavonoid glycosyltransferase YjiC (YdhE family)